VLSKRKIEREDEGDAEQKNTAEEYMAEAREADGRTEQSWKRKRMHTL